MEHSSTKIILASAMIFAFSESNLIVHEESSKQGIGNPNLLCEVVPNFNKVAATPDNAVFMLM